MSVVIESDALVLFQGDSITDNGRSRKNDRELGGGYAMMSAGLFSALFPGKNVRFLNRGVSGDGIADLQRRWDQDCLHLKPTWVSILIGINDTWNRYKHNRGVSAEAFEAIYRDILVRMRDQTAARLILCEPFLLPTPQDRLQWRQDLDPKIDVVRRLAREFEAILVPFDGLFAAASCRTDPAFWAEDGVHPTHAGDALMARAWLQAVGAL